MEEYVLLRIATPYFRFMLQSPESNKINQREKRKKIKGDLNNKKTTVMSKIFGYTIYKEDYLLTIQYTFYISIILLILQLNRIH